MSAGMGSEWREVSLGGACSKIGSGATPRGGKEAYLGGATALIRSQNIYNDCFVRDGLVFIDDKQAGELRNVVVEEGDVLLNITGDSVARCCQVALDVLPARVNQHVSIIRTKPDVLDARFLRYSLVSPAMQAHLLALASAGATRNALTKGMIESLSVSAPPIEEQLAIAHILGTLDDKIELNRKQNETLEAMARALFKAWFVDFEPVRAKLEGRWQRGQSRPGLPAHLYDLFPDQLVESELGEIPAGWRVSTVGEYFDLTMGQSPPGDTYNQTGIGTPFYQGRTDFGARFPTERVYCSAPTRWAKKGDVLVSVRAPVGDMNVALDDCAIGRGVAAVHHEHASFVLYALQSLQPAFKQFESEGTVFGAINKKQFEALQFVAATDEAVRKFESIAQSMDSNIENNEMQSRSLAQLRDTLLPKLISGELRVSDAEVFLKERDL